MTVVPYRAVGWISDSSLVLVKCYLVPSWLTLLSVIYYVSGGDRVPKTDSYYYVREWSVVVLT